MDSSREISESVILATQKFSGSVDVTRSEGISFSHKISESDVHVSLGTKKFSGSVDGTGSEGIDLSEDLWESDWMLGTEKFDDSTGFESTNEHSDSVLCSQTDHLTMSSLFSCSGYPELSFVVPRSAHFSVSNVLSLSGALTPVRSTVRVPSAEATSAVIVPEKTGIPDSSVPPASTEILASTVLVLSGQTPAQTDPPRTTIIPMSTVLPQSTFLWPASTIPPASTAVPASTVAVGEGQTPLATAVYASTLGVVPSETTVVGTRGGTQDVEVEKGSGTSVILLLVSVLLLLGMFGLFAYLMYIQRRVDGAERPSGELPEDSNEGVPEVRTKSAKGDGHGEWE
jgi:hypothetical protein